MSDFLDKQNTLSQTRKVRSDAKAKAYKQKELLRLQELKIKQRLKQERLAFLPDSDSDQELLIQLQNEVFTQEGLLLDAQRANLIAEEDFYGLDQHTNLVSQLNDQYPVLLLPVRIHTRFVTVKHFASNFSRNMVFDVSKITDPEPIDRVLFSELDANSNIPFQIPTYESLRNDGQNFRKNYARDISRHIKNNDLFQDKAWYKQREDRLELWVRIYPDDIFVHTHEQHLTPVEVQAGQSFWNAWWTIHREDDNALSNELNKADLTGYPLFQAWLKLQKRFQYSRAAWIFRATMPDNFEGDDTNYNNDPNFTDSPPDLKSSAWTQAIRSFVMPDKFVVTLIQDGVEKRIEGNPVPHPLPLSPEPDTHAQLSEVEWLKDFEAAEEIGMAIRIPLKEHGLKVTKPIQQLIVLGVKASTNTADSATLFENLITNHRYRGTSIGILPKGTPTNNFEDRPSGFSREGLSPQDAFRLEVAKPLFSNEAQWKTIKDGKYLTNALGLNDHIFQKVHKSNQMDIANSFAINRLLWSATMGYYLEQFFQPSISPEAIEQARYFFTNHVSAEGLIPTLRIGKQPYGILPVTNFSNWKFEESDDSFYSNLYEKILTPLNTIWDELVQEIIQITDPDINHQLSEEFVRILGLSPYSQSLYKRPQVGNFLLENIQGASFNEEPTKGPFSPGPNDPAEYIQYRMRTSIGEYYKLGLGQQLDNMGFSFPLTPWHFLVKTKERILSQHFSSLYRKYPDDIIDHLKPSEARFLTKQTIGEEEINYLSWLKQSSYQDLRDHHFPKENQEGENTNALLYLLARQALSRNYISLAAKLIPDLRKEISTIDFELEHLTPYSVFNLSRRITIPFSPSTTSVIRKRFGLEVHDFLEKVTGGLQEEQVITEAFLYSNNKWSYLEEKTPLTDDKTLGEFLDDMIASNDPTEDYLPLTDAKIALDSLEDLSTAELNRLLHGHLDLCAYRLDAWMLGLVNRRLDQLRKTDAAQQGLYLGAFGYLENLDPNTGKDKTVFRVLSNPEREENPSDFKTNQLVLPMLHLDAFRENGVDIDALLYNAVIYLGNKEYGTFERADDNTDKLANVPYTESNNQGFIHTPSPAHATTAAILRSGYLANNGGQFTDEFSVNLSSARVRKALYYIDGIKNGQALGALLGYQFERELHDNPFPALDAYLWEFRRAFPLTDSTTDNPQEKAFNVVNGLTLIDSYRQRNKNLDIALSAKGISISSNAVKNQIKRAIENLLDSLDAINDLLLSESVYQVAKGDLGRAGAVLKMLSNDREVETPQIAQSPKSGKLLNHLVGIQFDLRSTPKIWAGVDSPRSRLNPGLNRWLYEQLPNPRSMCINVRVDGERKKLSIRNLLFQPIDLLALFLEKEPFSETSALTYYIVGVAVKFYNPPIDAPIEVLYSDDTDFTPTQKTLVELKPLFKTLTTLVKNSRPLFPTDLEQTSKARPLSAASYEKLDHSDFLEVFEIIVNGKYKHSLYENYTKILSYTKYLQDTKAQGFPEGNAQATYTRLLELLHEPVYFNQLIGDYNFSRAYTDDNADLLIEQGFKAHQKLLTIATAATPLLEEVKSSLDKKQQWEILTQLTQLVFGNTLPLSPKFKLNNTEELKAAFDFPDLLADLPEEAVNDWLQGLSLVRDNLKQYKRLDILRTLFKVKAKDEVLNIVQLPFDANTDNYRWLGAAFRSDVHINETPLSIALELPSNYRPTNLQSGMIIDSWNERIQEKEQQTAFAMHYNQPNAEPPQSMLLCVSPDLTGNWQWEDLTGAVLHAMDLAKKRAVEPDLLEKEDANRPDNATYMKGQTLKFLLPALSIPVSNTTNTPALGFDNTIHHF